MRALAARGDAVTPLDEEAFLFARPGEPFDAVVFLHCLPRMQPIGRTLDRARESLAPGGLFVAEQVAFDRVNVHTARWLYDLESVLVAAEAIAPPDPRHAEERRPLARWRLEHVADPPFSSGHDLLAAARERLEMTLVEEAPGSIAPSPNARAPEIPARSAWWRPSSSGVAARPRARYRGRGTAFCGAAHRLIVRVLPRSPITEIGRGDGGTLGGDDRGAVRGHDVRRRDGCGRRRRRARHGAGAPGGGASAPPRARDEQRAVGLRLLRGPLAIRHAGLIDRRAAAFAFPLSLAGSAAGVLLTLAVRPEVLRPVVLVLLIAAAAVVVLVRPAERRGPAPSRLRGDLIWAAAALGIGAYDGFFGPGTGTFLILVLVTLLHRSLTRATADAKVVNFGSNLAAVAVFASRGSILWSVAIPMAAARLRAVSAPTWRSAAATGSSGPSSSWSCSRWS